MTALRAMFATLMSVTCTGTITSVNPEKQMATVMVELPGYIVHGLELFDQQTNPYGQVSAFRKKEVVVLRLNKRKGEGFLDQIMSASEEAILPPVARYDREHKRLWFPLCLDPGLLPKTHELPVLMDDILRQSWRFGIWAEVVSFKDRLLAHHLGEKAVGRVTGVAYDKHQPGNAKGLHLVLQDGTPAYLPSRLLRSEEQVVGSLCPCAIDKINPQDGYVQVHLIGGLAGAAAMRKLKETI